MSTRLLTVIVADRYDESGPSIVHRKVSLLSARGRLGLLTNRRIDEPVPVAQCF